MKRVVLVCAIGALVATSRPMHGQGGGSPFIDHSDTGEVIHVLPAPASIHSHHDTQPTDAPAHAGLAVYPASYGLGNLIDHGGHEIPNAGFFAIYWNSSVATSGGSQGNATLRATVAAFAQNYSDGVSYSTADPSADYSIVQQYGSTDAISPVLFWRGD